MAKTCGGGLSRVLWTAFAVCLVSAGCTDQLAFLNQAPDGGGSRQPAWEDDADQPVVHHRHKKADDKMAEDGKADDADPDAVPSASRKVRKKQDPDVVQAGPRNAETQEDSDVVQSAYQKVDKKHLVARAEPKAPAAEPRPLQPPVVADAAPIEPEIPPHLPIPNEKAKTYLPPYVIEPPDVLLIDAVRLVPKPPYRIEPLDVLFIQVGGTVPDQPITGPYSVGPEGTVNLGYSYGSFRVAGMTLEQAAAAIKSGLRLTNPQVAVALAQFRGVQQTRGEHLVGMDGTITLGTYGCVNVTGLTLSQAKCAIEHHLSRWLLDPVVSVSVAGFNSKVYYVITDGGGFGQQVYRFPVTGNETVLDAISQINGLPAVSSKRQIWLARPAPAQHGCYQILPVNWEVITEAGSTETNYQIFPGDRVYVKADPLITIDNQLAKILSPIERLFGATLLGNATVQSFRTNAFNGNNGGF